ncbi:lipoma HMGIC fusion partner-like 3 [Brachionus plicatilis]|uniref:Lipoma HMGIC fusion partner-like 3 n=1 Tax=Brachionus plicatilis TaxID=10195 RepID=A0A3M7R350_BRAPC|nr:lipoma HMGIC fusion partner-like 3 [Brachionus plicatilis]
MQSIITSTFNSVQLNYIRNSRAIAVLWFVFTVCFTIINIVVFLQPWLGDTTAPDKEGYFGLFEYCKYMKNENYQAIDDESKSHLSQSKNYFLYCDGSWTSLSSALNPIATFSIGFSALINLTCIATFLVLLLFVSPSIVFAICGFLQIISRCVIYPNNWDDPRIVDICETSRSYSSGKCEIKWAYILSIIGIFDILFLAILSLVMSRRQLKTKCFIIYRII